MNNVSASYRGGQLYWW